MVSFSSVEKKSFARCWAEHPDADDTFRAAVALFNDAQRALIATRELVIDPDVIAERDYILTGTKSRDAVPSREEVIAEAWTIATQKNPSTRQYINPADARLKAIETVARMAGYIQKESADVNVRVQSVMVVPAIGGDGWEQAATGSQAKLIEHAR